MLGKCITMQVQSVSYFRWLYPPHEHIFGGLLCNNGFPRQHLPLLQLQSLSVSNDMVLVTSTSWWLSVYQIIYLPAIICMSLKIVQAHYESPG